MTHTERAATAEELAEKYRDLSLLQLRARRNARAEARTGTVVTMSFSVRRVWSQITCSGPPCCPNAWFIETDDSEYVSIDSWHFLNATTEGLFPGRLVEVVVWPVSGRVIRAKATGDPIPVSGVPSEALVDLQNQYCECRVLEWNDLPQSVRVVLTPPN